MAFPRAVRLGAGEVPALLGSPGAWANVSIWRLTELAGPVGREEGHRLARSGGGRRSSAPSPRKGRAASASAPTVSRVSTIVPLPLMQASRGAASRRNRSPRRNRGRPARVPRPLHRAGALPGGGRSRGAPCGVRGEALLEQRDHSRDIRRAGSVERPRFLRGGTETGHGQRQHRQEHRLGRFSRFHALRPPQRVPPAKIRFRAEGVRATANVRTPDVVPLHRTDQYLQSCPPHHRFSLRLSETVPQLARAVTTTQRVGVTGRP